MTSIIEFINHYQRSIEKSQNDRKRLIHCIGKLHTIPITMEHLQTTGVGRTINSLRKLNGEVGIAAKSLVTKWKVMVATEEDALKEKKDKYNVGHHKSNECSNVKACDETKRCNSSDESIRIDCSDSKVRSESSTKYQKKTFKDDERCKIASDRPKISKNKSESTQSSQCVNDANKTNSHENSRDDQNINKHIDEGQNRIKRKSSSYSKDSIKRKLSPSELNSHSQNKRKVTTRCISGDGVDSSMGTSFEEVLGMCNVASTMTKNAKQLKSSSLAFKSGGQQAPDLLSPATKLEPLDSTIALDLPAISSNYKPIPLNPVVMECILSSNNKPKRSLTEEDTLCHGISSKNLRTKVYSGVKTGAIIQIPSLYDLCIRILHKNFDALEYTGGVPYQILEPVLVRVTPQQLLHFEFFNPYITEDTDVLWQHHVNRNYRNQQRQDMESWKEMFLRCKQEQDNRLSLLAENIKQSQKQVSIPVRKTQLAFVDSLVKPPRNIQRKQEQFGTKGKLTATPASRVAMLSNITPNIAKAGDSRLRVSPNVRDAAQAGTLRSRKAPLMQKTLQLMKGRFKR